MTIENQIKYLQQIEPVLQNNLEETTPIPEIINSLRLLKSAMGSNADSYIVEMKREDYIQFQEYKKFTQFTACSSQFAAQKFNKNVCRVPARKAIVEFSVTPSNND